MKIERAYDSVETDDMQRILIKIAKDTLYSDVRVLEESIGCDTRKNCVVRLDIKGEKII